MPIYRKKTNKLVPIDIYKYIKDNNIIKQTTVYNIFRKVNNKLLPIWQYMWNVTPWTSCSKPCGGGTRTRTVKCKRSDNVDRLDIYCSDVVKPITSQSCNTHVCLPIRNEVEANPRKEARVRSCIYYVDNTPRPLDQINISMAPVPPLRWYNNDPPPTGNILGSTHRIYEKCGIYPSNTIKTITETGKYKIFSRFLLVADLTHGRGRPGYRIIINNVTFTNVMPEDVSHWGMGKPYDAVWQHGFYGWDGSLSHTQGKASNWITMDTGVLDLEKDTNTVDGYFFIYDAGWTYERVFAVICIHHYAFRILE